MLRYVEGSSPIHRLWAGTKLLSLAALSVTLVLEPTWRSAGVVAALVLGGFVLARLPRGVAPRVPRWLWLLVIVAAALALVSGGKPELQIGSGRVGLGGLDQWALFSLIALEVLAIAALLTWTTPMAALAPALGRLAAPLRLVRLPVDEVIGAISLLIRCLPLLLDEARTLAAARRSRRSRAGGGFQAVMREAEETMLAALSNALRRSRELAEAIEARGGVPSTLPETHRLAGLDAVAMALCTAGVVAMALLR
ncbi:MAG: energy-coupling factor transporter transmembrane component T family protein [Acidimicrobiales bacterium]